MMCPYCDGVQMFYVGIQDGGGPFGSSLCDEFECPECGWIDESGCLEMDDLSDPDPPIDATWQEA